MANEPCPRSEGDSGPWLSRQDGLEPSLLTQSLNEVVPVFRSVLSGNGDVLASTVDVCFVLRVELLSTLVKEAEKLRKCE